MEMGKCDDDLALVRKDLTGRKGLEMSLDVELDSVRVPLGQGFDEQRRSMKFS